MKNRQSLIARIHQLTNTPRWGIGDLLYLCLVVIITISIANRIEWARSAPQLPPGWTIMAAPPVSPVGTGNTTTEPTASPTPITQKSIDAMIATQKSIDAMVAASAQKYGKSDDDVDRIKVTLHFLLYRESRYGKNKKGGDRYNSLGADHRQKSRMGASVKKRNKTMKKETSEPSSEPSTLQGLDGL